MNIGKNNKGITLVALVMSIILLLIISGISITGTLSGYTKSLESKQIAELDMIQHAILERYTKAQLTKEDLPGKDISIEEVQSVVDEINEKADIYVTLQGTQYKKLEKDDFEKLNITKIKDIYIVNYDTGEVINSTIKVTDSGIALYTCAKN